MYLKMSKISRIKLFIKYFTFYLYFYCTILINESKNNLHKTEQYLKNEYHLNIWKMA